MRVLAILFLFCSCNNILYSGQHDEGYFEQRSLLWKKNGEYRGISIIYNNRKDHWFYMTLQKNNCDSFFFSEHFKTSNTKENITNYFASRSGDIRFTFSPLHLQMFSTAKKLADSLGWCQTSILSDPVSLYLSELKRKRK